MGSYACFCVPFVLYIDIEQFLDVLVNAWRIDVLNGATRRGADVLNGVTRMGADA